MKKNKIIKNIFHKDNINIGWLKITTFIHMAMVNNSVKFCNKKANFSFFYYVIGNLKNTYLEF